MPRENHGARGSQDPRCHHRHGPARGRHLHRVCTHNAEAQRSFAPESPLCERRCHLASARRGYSSPTLCSSSNETETRRKEKQLIARRIPRILCFTPAQAFAGYTCPAHFTRRKPSES
jgi:hypothetical protein